MRKEKDSLGRELLPEDAVFGIHSSANFPSSGEKINSEFIEFYGEASCYVNNSKCSMLKTLWQLMNGN